uniref:Chromo domain-containing protein n=1 Tax=Panagrolaimus sp. ES5 TaxID=591445 RepID=A0AC34GX79_9BILA
MSKRKEILYILGWDKPSDESFEGDVLKCRRYGETYKFLVKWKCDNCQTWEPASSIITKASRKQAMKFILKKEKTTNYFKIRDVEYSPSSKTQHIFKKTYNLRSSSKKIVMMIKTEANLKTEPNDPTFDQ